MKTLWLCSQKILSNMWLKGVNILRENIEMWIYISQIKISNIFAYFIWKDTKHSFYYSGSIKWVIKYLLINKVNACVWMFVCARVCIYVCAYMHMNTLTQEGVEARCCEGFFPFTLFFELGFSLNLKHSGSLYLNSSRRVRDALL